jgi:hypothetical protein
MVAAWQIHRQLLGELVLKANVVMDGAEPFELERRIVVVEEWLA